MEKVKKKRYFARYMAKYSYMMIAGVAGICLFNLAVVKGNSVISGVIDRMLEGEEIILGDFLLEFLLLVLAGFVLALFHNYIAGLYSVKVLGDYRACVIEKLYRVDYACLKNENMATVINKINSDMAEAEAFLNGTFVLILSNLAAVIIYASYVGSLSISLLLLVVVSYPVVFFIAGRLVKRIMVLSGTYREKSDVITGIAQDALSGILVLRSFCLEDYFQERMHKATAALVDNEEKRTRISNTALVIRKMIQWLPNIICAVYSVVLVSQQKLSIGGLLAFVVVLGRLVEPFVGLPFNFVEAAGSIVCIRRIEEILNRPDERSGSKREGKTGADAVIRLTDIQFGYAQEKRVLNGIDLAVREGESIALVGESGGGKSTIFHLLCGFYPADSGSYRLYGREIAEWDVEAARERFALVSQDVFLFPASIEENVSYGNRDASHEEIVEACKRAQIHDFIMTLPQGYQTIVGERGAMLSGGQKQRIAIARALLKNAPILLLDEPTSAVDVETEELIQEALSNVMRGRTCITIAHRLSTIQNADRIYVLDGGRIAEYGTHEELLAKNGVYTALYEA